MSKIANIDICNRPREKALASGINTLTNQELLALIIRCGTKGTSALDIGENIIIEDITIKTQLVNINTATQTQLESLSGVGPSTALKIIQYREENGKFKSIEDIKNVPGIGDSKFDAIKEEIIEHFKDR